MDPKLVDAIVKGGVAVVLSFGMILILYTVVKDKADEKAFLREHMSRQTDALEKLVAIYSGD